MSAMQVHAKNFPRTVKNIWMELFNTGCATTLGLVILLTECEVATCHLLTSYLSKACLLCTAGILLYDL